MRRLLIVVVSLSILLLGMGIVGLSRQDLIAPLWTPGGFIGLVTFLVLVAIGVGMLAMANLFALAVWPARVQRNLSLLQAFPLRCALVGVLAILIQVFLVVHGLHGPLLLAVIVWDLVALAQGFPAVAELAGERLGMRAGPKAAAVGTAVLACGGTVPVLGWLMALGVTLQALGVHFIPTAKGGAL